MSRLRAVSPAEETPEIRALIDSAERTGAPDPRIVGIFLRNAKIGPVWVAYWNQLFYNGVLPVRLKELVRVKMSVAHQCGYCSTVRSKVARAEGLEEEAIASLDDFEDSRHFNAIDDDEVYAELQKAFTDEEIIELGLFCGEVDGAGKFARSMNVVTWQEACDIAPYLAQRQKISQGS
jgi:AhpD family alkylhydroperoxidase